MKTLSQSALVDIFFDITWKKEGIQHSEHYFVDHLNCWRDIFPGSPPEAIFDHNIGRPKPLQVNPGDIVPKHREDKILRLPRSGFNSDLLVNRIRFGRFYSQSMISGCTNIFKEVARILKPGGNFIVSFSNRWFPEKNIRIWEDLHDFERLGLVTEYFLKSDRYKEISTILSRGYPRL